MELSQSRLYRETFAAAAAFHARRFWLEHGNDECFAVVVPGEEHPMLASIMGQGGEEFGLMLFRGPDAYRHWIAMLDAHPGETEMPDDAAFMGFSMTRFGHVPTFGRTFLKKAGATCTRGSVVPFFVAKDAGRQPHAVTPEEVKKFLYVLRGVLKAKDAGFLTPKPVQSTPEIVTLVLGGDALSPDMKVELRLTAVSRQADVRAVDVPPDLHDLSHLPVRWLIGFPVMPLAVRDDDRSVHLVVIADEESEMIVAGEAVQGGVSDALRVIFDAFRGKNPLKSCGIPREVVVASGELFRAVKPMLDRLGVDCRHEPRIPLVDEIAGGFIKRFSGAEPRAEPLAQVQATPPNPDDLAGWKEWDRLLCRRAAERLGPIERVPDKAIARYFGDADAGNRFLADPDNTFPEHCFCEWRWLDFRVGKGSKSLGEKMLKEGLPEAERILQEARLNAVPSIYRVLRIERGVSLTLLDVLFGGEVVVHDRGLSESSTVDMGFLARVFPAGAFHFSSPLGPPLAPVEIDEAVDYLRSLGLSLTPEGAKAKAHLFGRLWVWTEETRKRAGMPRLSNSDGDDLCFHTATYEVHDEAAACAALAKRSDLELDDDGVRYEWLRREKTSAMFGEGLHLGTLTFVGEAMLVEVNSARRLAAAREWLDRVPGIRFHCVKVRSLDETMSAGVPLDDRRGPEDKVPMTPALIAHLRETIRAHYMEWLDTPLPALGGKTPRQTCRTEEGRKRVAVLIRCIPSPTVYSSGF
jgi:hypothetical protein